MYFFFSKWCNSNNKRTFFKTQIEINKTKTLDKHGYNISWENFKMHDDWLEELMKIRDEMEQINKRYFDKCKVFSKATVKSYLEIIGAILKKDGISADQITTGKFFSDKRI